MGQRPANKQNWQARNIDSRTPKFRIDVANPQMGLNGTEVYTIYGVTDNKDVSLVGLSEGGIYKIYNDQSIEIVAGQKSQGTGVDITITSRNGDICITADKNGRVRIRAQNIMIDADEDVDIKAGRNVNIESGSGRILMKGNVIDADGLDGNLVPKGTTFGEIAFAGTYVGTDKITSAFSSGFANVKTDSGGTSSCEPKLESPNASK